MIPALTQTNDSPFRKPRASGDDPAARACDVVKRP